MGYFRAGFEVIGVDIFRQPRYPFEFYQCDAMSFDIEGFDAIHASPPCQLYSSTYWIYQRDHPDLIPGVRKKLLASGLPYVIENVVGAPLREPSLLCGAMFPELRVYRHRLFETNWLFQPPPHPPHVHRQAPKNEYPKPGEFMQVYGSFKGDAKAAMGIDWMDRKDMPDAIPPAYTECIGDQLAVELGVPQEQRDKHCEAYYQHRYDSEDITDGIKVNHLLPPNCSRYGW